jgi:hypothetical protein
VQIAPLAVHRGGLKDSLGAATPATRLRELLEFRLPEWDVSPKRVPDSAWRARVNVFTPTGEDFLFSISTCNAEILVGRRQAKWVRTTHRVRGIVPRPSHIDSLIAIAEKYPKQVETPEEVYKSSSGRRVIGYAHREYFETCAPIWTLDKLPAWALDAFLAVTRGLGGASAHLRRQTQEKVVRRRPKLFVMPKPSWRETIPLKKAA